MNLKMKLFLVLPVLLTFQVRAQNKAAASFEMQNRPSSALGQRIASGTKAVFLRDVSRPAFGAAFRDSSGLVWSALLRDEKGLIQNFDHQTAAARACREAGGRLVTKSDIENLLSMLGWGTSSFSAVTTDGLDVIADFNVGPVILGDSPEFINGFQNWLIFQPQELYKNSGHWRYRAVEILKANQIWVARCVAKYPVAQ